MKKILIVTSITVMTIFITVFITSCEKEQEPVVPSVTTGNVSAITLTTATSGGNVTSDGGASVTARGICWGTTQNPATDGSKTSNGTGTGSFTSNLTGLTPGTQYYVRAYATNTAGTAYGNQQTFTTAAVELATLTTAAVSSYSESTAVSGGNITDDGGGDITARGVCWSSASQTPTVADSKTEDGTGTGSFTSNLTGLDPETAYYVRAYATNSAGTAYGDAVDFTTLAAGQVMDPDGNIYNSVTIGNQVWMAENLRTTKFSDGTPIEKLPIGNWSTYETPLYCWYENDSAAYADPYGALYNWYAAESGNLCPTGWHVPDIDEWNVLIGFLGGGLIAGGKLKETGTEHWESPNTDATDEYGFAALPGGQRLSGFYGLGQEGNYWSSTEYTNNTAFGEYRLINHDNAYMVNGTARKYGAFSIRCVKD